MAFTHPVNSLAYKYEFNGVSMRRINKTHNMSEVQSQGSHPITMDSYYLGIDTNETSSDGVGIGISSCLLYTSPSPRDATLSRMPSSA